jgi:hypothetical protein
VPPYFVRLREPVVVQIKPLRDKVLERGDGPPSQFESVNPPLRIS